MFNRATLGCLRDLLVGGCLGTFLGLGGIVGNAVLFDEITQSTSPSLAVLTVIAAAASLIAVCYCLTGFLFRQMPESD